MLDNEVPCTRASTKLAEEVAAVMKDEMLNEF
jgi:hypothetical protein